MKYDVSYSEELFSESGKFLCQNGIAFSFESYPSNVVEGGVEIDGMINDAVKTLIIPSGVKGFASNFCRYLVVTDIFILPDTVVSIGDDTFDGRCVFANTHLPEVFIPESVKMIGNFAFGGSHIEKLIISAATHAPYLRQFKDSTIEKVYLPKEILEHGNKNPADYYGFYRNFYMHCKCNIIEY